MQGNACHRASANHCHAPYLCCVVWRCDWWTDKLFIIVCNNEDTPSYARQFIQVFFSVFFLFYVWFLVDLHVPLLITKSKRWEIKVLACKKYFWQDNFNKISLVYSTFAWNFIWFSTFFQFFAWQVQFFVCFLSGFFFHSGVM